MDLKQPISLKTLGGKKAAARPTKTSINLAAIERAQSNVVANIGLFLVALVLIGIFAKFAVIDPLAQGMASSNEVALAQAHLEALEQANADYAELNQQYARYVVTGLTEEEQNLTDRDTILDLLQEKVLNVGYLSSLKVTDNTAIVTCLGVDLAKVSSLVQDVESDRRVAHVTVSTAQGENDATTSATINITFKGALDAQTEDEVMGALSEAAGKEAAQ